MKKAYTFTVFLILSTKVLFRQSTFETRDKIALSVDIKLTVVNEMYFYKYVLLNGQSAKQSVYKFEIHLSDSIDVDTQETPNNWEGVVFDEGRTLIRWRAGVDDLTGKFKDILRPQSSRDGFSLSAAVPPGIVDYYAEGWAPFPSFQEGEATDSIPGYTDLTPYGPGVVGKTIGPVQQPNLSSMTAFLETLISYTHRSVTLGWLGNDKTRERECEETMRGRDWYGKEEVGKLMRVGTSTATGIAE